MFIGVFFLLQEHCLNNLKGWYLDEKRRYY